METPQTRYILTAWAGLPPERVHFCLGAILTQPASQSVSQSLAQSVSQSLSHSFINVLSHSVSHSFIHSLSQSALTHSVVTHSFAQSRISLSHSVCQSLVHSFIHSPVRQRERGYENMT